MRRRAKKLLTEQSSEQAVDIKTIERALEDVLKTPPKGLYTKQVQGKQEKPSDTELKWTGTRKPDDKEIEERMRARNMDLPGIPSHVKKMYRDARRLLCTKYYGQIVTEEILDAALDSLKETQNQKEGLLFWHTIETKHILDVMERKGFRVLAKTQQAEAKFRGRIKERLKILTAPTETPVTPEMLDKAVDGVLKEGPISRFIILYPGETEPQGKKWTFWKDITDEVISERLEKRKDTCSPEQKLFGRIRQIIQNFYKGRVITEERLDRAIDHAIEQNKVKHAVASLESGSTYAQRTGYMNVMKSDEENWG